MDWSATIDDHKQRQAMHIGKVAARLALENGLGAVTMSGLARAAGVSRATIYNYVPNVEAAIHGYLRAQSRAFFERVDEAVKAEPDVVAKLRRYVAEQVAYVVSPEHATAAALMDAGLRPSAAHAGEAPELLRQIIGQGIREHVVRDELGVDALALLVSRMLFSAHELHTTLGMGEAALREGLTTVILDAVLARRVEEPGAPG